MERWAPIREAPGYDVSTRGRVRRGAFEVASWPNAKGYHLVSIELPGHAYPALRYVHRLVLEAFVAPAAGRIAHHADHDKGHNALVNLTWVTTAQNARLYRRALAERYGQRALLFAA